MVNRKVMGMMKDELNGHILSHFVAVCPNLYLFKIDGMDYSAEINVNVRWSNVD